MNQQQIIKQCKCDGKALARSSFDCSEQNDVWRVECPSCGDSTQWPHLDRRDAVNEWNKMQGAGHE